MPVKVAQIKHLYHRIGFGVPHAQLVRLTQNPYSQIVEDAFKQSNRYQPLELDIMALTLKEFRELSPSKKKEIMAYAREKNLEMNNAWLDRLSTTDAVLREKMTLFWHGHFACETRDPHMALQLNNAIRKNALGSFKKLVLAVSKSPAMLQYLNNQQNRKKHPNENFARELMELFTIGRGHYTENDIKEAARSFTGWGFNFNREFVFRSRIHDYGRKEFLGKSGNFNGEDIIDILLEQYQTAQFISGKVYQYFVNAKINEQHVRELADQFFHSDYDISVLMKTLMNANWFHDRENVGNKIKSPVELLVSLNRQFEIAYEDPKSQLKIQRLLGQVLFHPPNVAGWPGNTAWIDSSSLMLRLRIPSILLNSGVIDWEPKDDKPEMFNGMQKRFRENMIQAKVRRHFNAAPNWDHFFSQFDSDPNKDQLVDQLIAGSLSGAGQKMVDEMPFQEPKAFVLNLLSLPEYQLC